jgi:hypothetical protein
MDCWHYEIDKAKSEADIVRSACDYLLLWAPRELDPLHLGLAEMRIESPDDIERVKRWLGDPELPARTGNTNKAHMQELAIYFSHASLRIGELRRMAA